MNLIFQNVQFNSLKFQKNHFLFCTELNSALLLEGKYSQNEQTFTKAESPYGELGYLVSKDGTRFCTVTPVAPLIVFTARRCLNIAYYYEASLIIEEAQNYVDRKLESGGKKMNDDFDLAAIKVS